MKSMVFSLLLIASLFLTLSASAQWSTNPAVNNAICALSGEQAIPKVAVCSNGDLYVGWFSNESGNYNVRLQRLDALGNTLWATDGILISNQPQETWLTDWDMTCDPANHAILAFNDIRLGNANVVAYRISPSGSFVWGANGIQLSSNSAFNAAPKVISTNAGNMVFAWTSDDVIIMQKVNPSGVVQWGANGITLSAANPLTWPQLLPVGTDDFILKYFSDTGPGWSPTRHVYARRYDGSGNPVWASPTAISTAGGISAWTQIFPFINDGSDGFYIAWHDDRDNNQRASAFVQHVSSTGALLFPANGVEVSNLAGMNHYYPTLALPTGSSDVYCFWNEMNPNQDNWGIFGQKISSTGTLQWGAAGMTFIPVTATNVYPYEAQGTPNDVILVYEEYSNAINGQIKAMRVSPSGAQLWTPALKTICSVLSEKVHPVVTNFHNNQLVVSWEDSRSGNKDIYAQNIQLDGSLGPSFAGTISGNITLNGGSGIITQVVVTAGSYTTNPDPSGFYTLTVPTGTYTVSASLSGYQPASQSNAVVNANQTTTVNLTLTPVPVGYIQGTVTLSGGNGIITQVQVHAGSYVASPDMTGQYTLIVTPGTFDVIATLSGYYNDTVAGVVVPNQQTVTGINLTLLPAPTNGLITGTVTLNGGTGNVTQVVVTAGGGVASTSPNAAGFYTLDLPAGNYDVTASLSGYATQMQTGVPVLVGQTTPNINFTLSPAASTGTIHGQVSISGEYADVTQATVSTGTYSAHPDAAGFYSLVVPAPGVYNVTATHPYTTTSTLTNVNVVAGQTTGGVNFLLEVNRADMIVKATDNFGTPVNGVSVVIQGPEGPYTGTITNDSIIFLHVPYGVYNGTANLTGFQPVYSDTTISNENHRLIFIYYIDGIAETGQPFFLRVSPNPAGADARVSATLPVTGRWTMEFFNTSGIKLHGITLTLNSGDHRFSLNELTGDQKIRNGVIFIRMSGPGNYSATAKVIFND